MLLRFRLLFIALTEPSCLSCGPERYLGRYFPDVHGFPGKQSGSGSPPNCLATPNAAPKTINNTPAMIFAFTVALQAAGSGFPHGFYAIINLANVQNTLLYPTFQA